PHHPPFLHLSCPRLKPIFLSQIWCQICNVKCGTNPKICTKIKLIYAFSFTRYSTLKGPSALGINLDFLISGNLSFRKCNQTKSPSSKVNCLLPLSPATLYLAFMCSMFSLVTHVVLTSIQHVA